MMPGFERVTHYVDYEGISRTVAFDGRVLAHWSDNGGVIEHTAYMTGKGNIAIISLTGDTYLYVYESFEDLEEEYRERFSYSTEFISEIAEELDKEFVEELDI